MKLAIPGEGTTLDSAICPQFGRAPFFCFYDTEGGTMSWTENTATAQTGGAGIASAQFLIDHHVEILITMQCGKNAAEVLKKAGIVLLQAHGLSIADNIASYKEGALVPLSEIGKGMHKHA